MDYKYNAIILSKTDISETDRLYNVYTSEAGKIKLLAKGIRKPNAKLAGSLEPLTYSEIFVAKGRGRGNITGAISINNFLLLKNSLAALENIFRALGIFDKMIVQEEKDEKIFQLLKNYLEAMEENTKKNDDGEKEIILTLGFIFKLLENSGYGLQTRKCVECGERLKSGKNFFSAEKGGILCATCSQKRGIKIKISDEAIKFIRIISENELVNLHKIKAEKKSIQNLRAVATEMVRWILG
jgi:DNA repair protein RecO (recombination protein O)